MDLNTVVVELRKRPDVTLKRGSKHTKVMDLEGRQLAVISRGARADKGRDAKNLLATLRRNGIDLEGGQVSTAVKHKNGATGVTPERLEQIRMDAAAAMAVTGLSRYSLAERIFEVQNRAIVGGQKYKSLGVVRDAVYRIFREGDKAQISLWGAEVFEHSLKVIVDEYVAENKAEPVAEKEVPVDGIIKYHDRPVIQEVFVDGVRTAEFLEPRLEEARLVVEDLIVAMQAKKGYESHHPHFPHGKGTVVATAKWLLAWASARGFVFHGGKKVKGADPQEMEAVLASRLGRFVFAKNFPISVTREEMLWAADLWTDLKGLYGDEALSVDPLVSGAAVGLEPKDETVKEDAPEQTADDWVSITDYSVALKPEPVVEETPLHIRAMSMMKNHYSEIEVHAVVVEIMRLEQETGRL